MNFTTMHTWSVCVSTILAVAITASVATAGSVALVDSEMEMTPFDASLLVSFDASYETAQVSLSSIGLSSSWTMGLLGPAENSYLFSTEDGLAELAVVMNDTLDLSDETFADIERFDFRWAYPPLNGEEPSVWLGMTGTPSLVPEASALALIVLGVCFLGAAMRN
jgi:hypothetical protein